MNPAPVSIVIPTYQRDRVLIDTVVHLLKLEPAAAEIVLVDQTLEHERNTRSALTELEREQKIRWIRLSQPSITRAMNVGLAQASCEIVLFVDDDIIPCRELISAHARGHAKRDCNIVAGQVLQPGEEPFRGQKSEVGGQRSEAREELKSEDRNAAKFLFRSNRRQYITELMGGNFSIKRDLALRLGGFDENFVHVAYRFEAEFAARALAAGERILFEPGASIRHLKAASGGTRAYGNHLTTIKPSHAVGEYYYLLRAKQVPRRLQKLVARPLRAIRTRHHLFHPWWIPGTLIAETWGFLWAVSLAARGPRLIGGKRQSGKGQGSANEGRKSEVGGQEPQVGIQTPETQFAIRNSQSAIPHD